MSIKDANIKGLTFVEKTVLANDIQTAEEAIKVVTEELCRRYGMTSKGTAKLKELGMETTKSIRKNVEIWFIMRKLYPDCLLTDKVQKSVTLHSA